MSPSGYRDHVLDAPDPAPAPSAPTTVAEAGERETLRRILAELPEAPTLLGPGDDSAIVAAPDGRVVISTDTMIEGPDFRLYWSGPEQLGRKAMASNLADIAAMGARPTGIVMALAVPRETPVDFAAGIARGCAIGLERLAPGCGIVGGDLATASEVTIAVTVFGSLDGRDAVLRSGARPGDTVAVAGGLGRAAAGLHLLFAGIDRMDRSAGRFAVGDRTAGILAALGAAGAGGGLEALIAAQLAPEPPLRAGVLAARAGATAMMDLSDGPLLDATRLAEASGVCIRIDSTTVAADAARLVPTLADALGLGQEEARELALRLVLGGGEDHSLLATFPEGAPLPEPFRAIGRVAPAGPASVLVDGEPAEPAGWDPYVGMAGAGGAS